MEAWKTHLLAQIENELLWWLQGDYLGGITNQVCEAKGLKTPKQHDESKLGQSTDIEKNRDVGH